MIAKPGNKTGPPEVVTWTNNNPIGWRHVRLKSTPTLLFWFNSLSRLRTKNESKLRITGPLWGESDDSVIRFPSQRASIGHQIPLTKGQYCGKRVHAMQSSWRKAWTTLPIFCRRHIEMRLKDFVNYTIAIIIPNMLTLCKLDHCDHNPEYADSL